SAEGHFYILAATDYFSKWAEAVPLFSGKKEEVVDFIKSNIIYRYGVPRCTITDNGKSFDNKMIEDLFAKFKFKKYHLSM
ncbi:integrase catalytic domain-containing protein, partial [Mycobacterium tuberculosis]